MKKLTFILTLLISCSLQAQLVVQSQTTLSIGGETTVAVGSDVINEGSFQNLGKVSFTHNWNNKNTYNDGTIGALESNGSTDQTVSNNNQTIGTFIVNTEAELTFTDNTMEIMQELRLQNGIVRLGDGTSLVINAGGQITGGSEDSFVAAPIIQKGGGNRFYPLGIENTYMPIEFLDIVNNGTELEMSVRVGLFSEAGVSPTPAGSVIGVSDYHYWQIEEINGEFFNPNGVNGSLIKAGFNGLDINPDSFAKKNVFPYSQSTVSLVQAPTLEGEFLRVNGKLLEGESDFDKDSETASKGIIDTVDPVNQMFVGVGLVASSNPEGVMFIPTAFSPTANNPENRALKAFGDNVLNEPFTFAVFNSFGMEVYTANSLAQANEGWDGINPKNGKAEPMGSYRYYVQYTNNEGDTFKRSGVSLLIR